MTPKQNELRKRLLLQEETGTLYWKEAPSTNTKPGQKAGYLQKSRNRWKIKIDSKEYMLHNIVWVHMHGDRPSGLFVDHIDRDASNNAASNLRLVTHRMNCQNRIYRKAKNTHVGVYASGNGWVARISIAGVLKHLGYFKAKENAINARESAVAKYNQLHLVHKTQKEKV